MILIDDASLFTGENDYPSMEKLQEMIDDVGGGYRMHVEFDIIRIHK